jgi:tryptophan halogenase
MKVSDRLQEKMDLYQANGRIYREDNELFNETSWLSVMNGQGLVPSGYHPFVDALTDEDIDNRLKHIHKVIQKSVDIMPLQTDFINKYCKA